MIAAPVSPQPTANHPTRVTAPAQLRRLQWAVRATLTLGVAASLAANVLHARPHPISQIIAAWPPLALLLTVELISRVPAHRRSLAAIRLTTTAAIAGIAAWISYHHMAGVAAHYGETGAAAYLLPISVDGLVVVASISLVEIAARSRATETDPPPATGHAHQTGNGQHQEPEPTPTTRDPDQPATGIAAEPVCVAVAPSPRSAVAPRPRTVAPSTPTVAPTADTVLEAADPNTPRSPADRARHRPADHRPQQSYVPAGNRAGRTSPDRPGTTTTGAYRSAQYRPPTHARPAALADAHRIDEQPPARPGVPRPAAGTPLEAAGVVMAQTPLIDGDGRSAEAGAGGGDTIGSRRVGPQEAAGHRTADDAGAPTDTSAAVAYWHRRHPGMHPAEIAEKIGRSERTVRRHWPTSGPRRSNGTDPSRLAETLRGS